MLMQFKRPRGVTVDLCPKQSGWLINQLGVPQFKIYTSVGRCCVAGWEELHPLLEREWAALTINVGPGSRTLDEELCTLHN
jgi:hypothetical protein